MVSIISSFCFATQAQVFPYPDNSIATEDYKEMSFPPLDTVWGARDYKRAMRLLEDIYKTDKFSLPRYGSPYSKTVFEQLTSVKNLDRLNDKEIDIEQRLEALNQLPEQISRLLVIYMEGIEAYRFGAEMLYCFAFYAHYTSNALDLVAELQAQIGERGQELRFIRGQKAMEKKHLDICNQILSHLIHDEEKFPDKVLEDFSLVIEQDFLHFYKKNPLQQQRLLQSKIQKALPQLSNKTIRKVFKRWLKEME